MKRILTLTLCLNVVVFGLFAQNNEENSNEIFTMESGLYLTHTTRDNFPIPLSFETQKRTGKWGFGGSLSVQYDRKSWGDCTKRYAIGTFVEIGIEDIGNFSSTQKAYCESFHYLSLKPSVFGSYYFLEKKNWNMFAKFGFMANWDIIEWKKGYYFTIENNTMSKGLEKVVKSEPDRIIQKIPLLELNNVGFLGSIGLNYFLNEKTALRFTIQSERNTSLFIKTKNIGYLLFALCGVSFKI